MYKPYLETLEHERKLGLFQPRSPQELLIPVKPLPGIYNGHIWDIIEAGDKLIVRFDLERGVYFDWEIWAKEWKSDKPSWQLLELLKAFGVREAEALKGKPFKGARIDRKYNVIFNGSQHS